MNRNLFISLFKYKPNLQVLPEENFITESFVYVLYQSLTSDQILFNAFIKLLNPKLFPIDYSLVYIDTQKVFDLDDNTRAIPDIVISIDKRIILIEVKVSADMNQYEVKENQDIINFNQIEKYQKINSDKEIYILTLRKINEDINAKDYVKNILWEDVYDIFYKYYSRDNSNYIVNDFLNFLSDQNMIIPKINKEIVDCSSEIRNLITLIDLALNDLSYTKTISDGRFYRGFNIALQDPKCVVWIGYLYKDTAIKMQIITPEINNHYLKNKDSTFSHDPDNKSLILISRLEISSNDFIEKKSVDQLECIKEWIIKNTKCLLEDLKK